MFSWFSFQFPFFFQVFMDFQGNSEEIFFLPSPVQLARQRCKKNKTKIVNFLQVPKQDFIWSKNNFSGCQRWKGNHYMWSISSIFCEGIWCVFDLNPKLNRLFSQPNFNWNSFEFFVHFSGGKVLLMTQEPYEAFIFTKIVLLETRCECMSMKVIQNCDFSSTICWFWRLFEEYNHQDNFPTI